MNEIPKYPIHVMFQDESEIETYRNEMDLVTSLEWFDSTDKDYPVQVTDVTGASVILKIEALKVITLIYSNI